MSFLNKSLISQDSAGNKSILYTGSSGLHLMTDYMYITPSFAMDVFILFHYWD